MSSLLADKMKRGCGWDFVYEVEYVDEIWPSVDEMYVAYDQWDVDSVDEMWSNVDEMSCSLVWMIRYVALWSVFRIRMFLGYPDPDPWVTLTSTDPDPFFFSLKS